jgi:hypothetical protein
VQLLPLMVVVEVQRDTHVQADSAARSTIFVDLHRLTVEKGAGAHFEHVNKLK